MPIKNVLYCVDDGPNRGDSVEAAVVISEKFGANLTGCYVIPNTAMAIAAAGGGGVAAPQLITEMQEQAKSRAAAAEQDFKMQLREMDRTADWLCLEGSKGTIGPDMARQAHYADLVVARRPVPEEGIPYDYGTASDLIADAGCPVILVPPELEQQTIGEKVVIGWNETREASRAVHDALPFLVRAKSVTVVMAVPESWSAEQPPSGEKIGTVLKEHGATVHVEPMYGVVDKDSGDALLACANDIHADLLVIGAFSHTRLREGIFGGVTRQMIEETRVPTLMSH